VQNRRVVGDGGESVIPPARTQCFSKSARDLALNAARKPSVTAMIAFVSGSEAREVEVGKVHLFVKPVGVG